ncbi:hypothetical protein [Bacillus toyonensis]|nr:hypothetical protein [Bacillus toyonensis]
MKLYNVTVNEKHFAKEMLPHISIPNVYVIASNEADATKLATDKFKQSLQ